MDFVSFALLGLGVGSVYALIALGVVVVYRASGVLNFSTGAIGAVAAFVYYDLNSIHGWSSPPALVVSLLCGGVLGAAIQFLVMSRLRRASTLTKLIASLGLLTLLQGAVEVHWGTNPLLAPSLLPNRSVHLFGSLDIGEDRLLLIGLVAVLGVALKLIYSVTPFGRATLAVAENRRAAASLGWSTNSIELVNWVVGGVLSALAGILLAPIVGLQASELTLLIVPALAAALVGSFSSFGLTVAGGLLVGVIESEMSRYASGIAGAGQSVPFLVIIVVVVLGGRARPARGDLAGRLPLLGSGKVPIKFVTIAIAVALVLVWTVSGNVAASISTTFIAALVVVSVIVVTGYAGQVSLGQWALAGFGAFVAARLAAVAHVVFWIAAPVGIVATVVAGMLVALPALRSRGVNLAVATLGMALVVETMILGNVGWTGGVDGTAVRTPSIFGFKLDDTRHPARYATFVLVCFILVMFMVANVRRGKAGRRMIAVRSDESAAASLGVSVYGVKLYAFGLAGGIAALAGILAAFENPVILFSQFDIFGSINAILESVIGGVGWISGSVYGAFFASGSIMATILQDILGSGVNTWLPIIGGVAVIGTLISAPEGIGANNARQFHRLAMRLEGKGGKDNAARAPRLPSRPRHPAAELRIRDLTVRYGGVVALDTVNFDLRAGEVVGLIGPNGAGKTTLLDAVTGFTRPTNGSVELNGQDITGWSPVRRARSGMSRSFQAVALFEEMTVRENLLVGADTQGIASYFMDLVRPGRTPTSDLMEEVIGDFELGDVLDAVPSSLPQGTRRLVGIARSVVGQPAAVFLDEPAAGLDDRESAELGLLIRQLAEDRGIAVLLVEHDVPMVMATCDRIVVLDFGRVIAQGTPTEIRQNEAVVTAYLGAAPDEAQNAPVLRDEDRTAR